MNDLVKASLGLAEAAIERQKAGKPDVGALAKDLVAAGESEYAQTESNAAPANRATVEWRPSMSPTAKVMLKALAVAYPEPVTIAPKTDLGEEALAELREGDFIELWDSWPNGDRRWMATPLGRQPLPPS